jgi:hypothetical protein
MENDFRPPGYAETPIQHTIRGGRAALVNPERVKDGGFFIIFEDFYIYTINII